MEVDIQWGLSSARVDVSGGSPVVVYEVGDTVYCEPHLPALWKWLLIEQPKKKKKRLDEIFSDGFFQKRWKQDIYKSDKSIVH